MNKNYKKQIIIAAIVLLIAASAGIFFYACQKDEAVKTTSSTYCATCEAENAEKVLPDIDELIAQTGIDIYALSEKEYVKKYVITNIIYQQDNNITISSSKSKKMEEDLSLMETLLEQMQDAQNKQDYAKVYATSERFFALIDDHDLVSLLETSEIKFAIQDFIYNGVSYRLPINYLQQQQEVSTLLITSISSDYPKFQTLSTPAQTQVLATSFVLSAKTISVAKTANTQPYEECVRKAKTDHEQAFGVATSALAIGISGCAKIPNPWILAGCMLVQTGLYTYAIYSANNAYETSVELCKSKFPNH